MIFGNPVRQAYIRPPNAINIQGSFRMTQDFGPTSLIREPTVKWAGGEGIPAKTYANFHRGIDIFNGKCGDDVLAAESGTVDVAMRDPSSGDVFVVINHGGGWGSEYSHLSKEVVSKGQKVVKGQKIGSIGDTGNSTSCHLHFMVKSGVDFSKNFFDVSNGKLVDPWPRLIQNMAVKINGAGINIRSTAGGVIFAKTKSDGYIRRESDGADLGPTSQPHKWGGTVKGPSYTVGNVTGNTWEKIDLDGAWRYVASVLTTKSRS